MEAKLDRLIGEVRSEIRASLGELRAEIRFDELRGQMRAGFDRLDAALDGFERRMTIRFFVYFMSQGVLTAAMIVWMVGILR